MPAPADRTYKHLDTLTLIFVVVLLISNLVAQKICKIGPLTLSGAELLFPITYIFGDIFTEVYGYAASRRAIWIGFFASALLSIMGAIVVALPPAPGWHNQAAFATVFGFIPRLVVASLIAYWAGEFTNSFTLAKMKLLTGGRWLWTRTVGSTITGQAVDTATVVLIAFWGKAADQDIGGVDFFRLYHQSNLRDCRHAVDLCGGGLAEEVRGFRCVRRAFQLQSISLGLAPMMAA